MVKRVPLFRIMTSFDLDKIPSQKGKIAIVTGANTGLGYETALVLAKKEMKVILACKSLERAEKAKHRILRKLPHANLEIMIIDLSSLSSVRRFAKSFLSRHSQLDLLINNAGILIPPYSRTENGFESQMGVNYFGHFLLTGLLFDVITKTPGSRIVSVASNAHIKGTINFDDLHWEKRYSPLAAYRQSKLACLMFAYELQRRLEKAGFETLSVAAHPGLSITDILRKVPKWLLFISQPVTALFTHSPAKGALPILNAAIGPDVKGGEYYGPQGRNEWKGDPGLAGSTPLSNDKEVARRLWEVSEKLTGIEFG
jgi:NAD(P)-dependent dehydrogenase (short-subunit alcohol dehydrogenase family)